eukprot:228009-Chlamydomonas_euryale.AAC.2
MPTSKRRPFPSPLPPNFQEQALPQSPSSQLPSAGPSPVPFLPTSRSRPFFPDVLNASFSRPPSGLQAQTAAAVAAAMARARTTSSNLDDALGAMTEATTTAADGDASVRARPQANAPVTHSSPCL